MPADAKFETEINIKYFDTEKKKSVKWDLPEQSFDLPSEEQAKAIYKFMIQQFVKKKKMSEEDVKNWTTTPWENIVDTFEGKAPAKPKTSSFAKHAVYVFKAKRGEKKTVKEISAEYKKIEELPDDIRSAVEALM